MLPERGTHHVVSFENVSAGQYAIRATGARDGTELTAAFIPLGRVFNEMDRELANSGSAPPGKVRLVTYALPYSCWVGDKLDLQVDLTGQHVTDAVNFQVRLETRERLPGSVYGHVEYGPPLVQGAAVLFARTADGRYRGSVFPQHPGILRIWIRASGKTVAGRKFSEEAIWPELTVNRLVARLGSISEKAVPADSKETLERLALTADLDVYIPGEYEMKFWLSGSGNREAFGEARQTLSVGDQSITASISASVIRARMGDGPWMIRNLQIFRALPGSLLESVATDGVTLETAAYRRDQWDRGAIWGDEHVTVHGIEPSPSGRFRLVEADWNVFTPGGNCSWSASLQVDDDHSENAVGFGTLPEGPSTLTFFYDAALIAAAPKEPRFFAPILQCSVSLNENWPLRHVTLDPAQFEPQASSFHLQAGGVRIAPGGHQWVVIEIVAEDYKPTILTVGSVPGIQYTIPAGNHFTRAMNVNIQPAPDLKPGRYFVPVAGTAGNETATTEIVVNVISPQ